MDLRCIFIFVIYFKYYKKVLLSSDNNDMILYIVKSSIDLEIKFWKYVYYVTKICQDASDDKANLLCCRYDERHYAFERYDSLR